MEGTTEYMVGDRYFSCNFMYFFSEKLQNKYIIKK